MGTDAGSGLGYFSPFSSTLHFSSSLSSLFSPPHTLLTVCCNVAGEATVGLDGSQWGGGVRLWGTPAAVQCMVIVADWNRGCIYKDSRHKCN